MTADEKKMTVERAEKIIKFCGDVCAHLDCKLAKGFLLGRESGIRESAEKLSGRYGHCPGECRCVYLQEQILALLPDGSEGKDPGL